MREHKKPRWLRHQLLCWKRRHALSPRRPHHLRGKPHLTTTRSHQYPFRMLRKDLPLDLITQAPGVKACMAPSPSNPGRRPTVWLLQVRLYHLRRERLLPQQVFLSARRNLHIMACCKPRRSVQLRALQQARHAVKLQMPSHRRLSGRACPGNDEDILHLGARMPPRRRFQSR